MYENQPRSCIPLLFPMAVWTSLLLLLRKAGGQPFLCAWHWAAVQGPSLWNRLCLLSWQALQTLCTEAGSSRGVLLVWEARGEFWLVALASGGVLCCFFEHRIGFRFRVIKELLLWSGQVAEWWLWWWRLSGQLSISSDCAGSLLWGGFVPFGSCSRLPVGFFNSGEQQTCAVKWAQEPGSASCASQSVLAWRVDEFVAYCCEIEPCCWGRGFSSCCVSNLVCPLRQAGICTWAMSLFLHEFLCSSPHFPEWFNISQHTGLMMATQPCSLCNSYLVGAVEIAGFLLLHQGLLWAEPWGFDGAINSPPKNKEPFSAGVQIAAGLQCGWPCSVAKGGEVYPCPQNPFWIHDLPLKARVSTCKKFMFVQLCVLLKTKTRRSFPILGKRCFQSGCREMLLEKFTSLRAQLNCTDAQVFVSVALSELQHWPYWFIRQILSPGSFLWKLAFSLPLFSLR